MMLIEPHELVFEKKRVFLKGVDLSSFENVKLSIEYIRSHRQLPRRIQHTQEILTTISFCLKGRLAKNYRKRPEETLWDKGDFVLVHTTTADVEGLLLRLIKYGHLCQVVSPASVRGRMLTLIQKRLVRLKQTNAAMDEPLSQEGLE